VFTGWPRVIARKRVVWWITIRQIWIRSQIFYSQSEVCACTSRPWSTVIYSYNSSIKFKFYFLDIFKVTFLGLSIRLCPSHSSISPAVAKKAMTSSSTCIFFWLVLLRLIQHLDFVIIFSFLWLESTDSSRIYSGLRTYLQWECR